MLIVRGICIIWYDFIRNDNSFIIPCDLEQSFFAEYHFAQTSDLFGRTNHYNIQDLRNYSVVPVNFIKA